MNTQTFNILNDALAKFAVFGCDSLKVKSETTATFSYSGKKYAVTLCYVDTHLALTAKISPTLCLYYSALAFAKAEGAIPLLCVIGSNGVGVITAVARYQEGFYPTDADNLNHIAIDARGNLSVIAFNYGGRDDD